MGLLIALIRAAERWRGIKITELEQRQLKAVGKGLIATSLPAIPRQ